MGRLAHEVSFKIVGKPSKYHNVVKAFRSLSATRALEFDVNGDTAKIRSGVSSALNIAGEKFVSMVDNDKLYFYKGEK